MAKENVTKFSDAARADQVQAEMMGKGNKCETIVSESMTWGQNQSLTKNSKACLAAAPLSDQDEVIPATDNGLPEVAQQLSDETMKDVAGVCVTHSASAVILNDTQILSEDAVSGVVGGCTSLVPRHR